MKKTILFVLIITLSISCGIKKTQNLVNEGDYDAAIDRAISGLKSNKTAKSNQDYVYLLEEAFAKAKERDLSTLNQLSLDKKPTDLEAIYSIYDALNKRQNKIRPLLPLPLLAKNRNAYFPFDTYDKQLINSRDELALYLYQNANSLLNQNQKLAYRKAFDDLVYLNEIYPNYKNVATLIPVAQTKGTDYVYVNLRRDNQTTLPAYLQNIVTSINLNQLNDEWTVYHNQINSSITYNFEIGLQINGLQISPERTNRRDFAVEKEIRDGYKTQVDRNGAVVKDSVGHNVKVEAYKVVSARITEFNQLKACQINATVVYLNLQTNQLLYTFPLESELLFENRYAIYKGDIRAVDLTYSNYFSNTKIPFATNQQLLFDTAEALKLKFNDVIFRNNIVNY